MYINGTALLEAEPIKDMLSTKERLNGVSHGLAEAGYDIRIAESVRFNPGQNPLVIINGTAKPGRFTIASAVEEFQMPDNMVAFVKDKSTWARKGLSVFNTVIEPGWKGFLTLELVYHGNEILTIPAGSGIAQVMFAQIQNPAEYAGKYQHQAQGPQESIFQ